MIIPSLDLTKGSLARDEVNRWWSGEVTFRLTTAQDYFAITLGRPSTWPGSTCSQGEQIVSIMPGLSDGNVDEDERDILEEISEHLGLKDDAVDRLLEWTVEGYAWMQIGYDLLNDLSR